MSYLILSKIAFGLFAGFSILFLLWAAWSIVSYYVERSRTEREIRRAEDKLRQEAALDEWERRYDKLNK